MSLPGVAPAGSVSSVIGIELYVFTATTDEIVCALFKQPSECFFVRCLVFERHRSHGLFEAFEGHSACANSEYIFKRFLQSWLNIQVTPETLIDSLDCAHLGIDFS